MMNSTSYLGHPKLVDYHCKAASPRILSLPITDVSNILKKQED